MGVFDGFMKKVPAPVAGYSRPSTANFHIGIAEAEGEASGNGEAKLKDFFEDYLNILNQINNEKFIILGRKGSGKTAIGEYICYMSQSEPNIFSKFIKKDDIDIERIVQIGKGNHLNIENVLLYRWVILTQLLSLFLTNESLSNEEGMNHLRKFYERNRGFIEINKYEINEVIRSNGISVNIEYLKRYLTAKGEKGFVFKESKAEFYKLLPCLEKVVVDILLKDHDNSYVLCFDDLDLGLKCSHAGCFDVLLDLLRVVKYYNNDVFGKNGLKSKILVLLRKDISDHILYDADSAKILSSYACELNWYEDFHRYNEPELSLRKFINKRIKVNFESNGYVMNNSNDPWTSFVNERDFYDGKSGFKYIIDYTFFRPRDLILFFKDIDTLCLPLPISKFDIQNKLLRRYAVEMMKEIRNELSLLFSNMDITGIINSLRMFSDRKPFIYRDLVNELSQQNVSGKLSDAVNTLFDYSLIGNKYEDDSVVFKHRSNAAEPCELDKDAPLILHYALQAYYKFNP